MTSSSSNDRELPDLGVDLDLDLDLAGAFRSVRDEYDGTSADADLTLQRALFKTRKKTQKQRLTHWILLPAAAVLIASTAFAGVTGRLNPAVRTVIDTLHGSSDRSHPMPLRPSPVTSPSPANDPTRKTDPEPPPATLTEPEPTPESVPTPAPAPTPIVRSEPRRPTPAATTPTMTAAASPTQEPSASPHATAPASTNDPSSPLFAEAHRLHFVARDPARALVAWDRYLASSPDARFAPEARYNRALTLVRLGRHAEAKRELEAFATGTYGKYHQADAQALLTALTHN